MKPVLLLLVFAVALHAEQLSVHWAETTAAFANRVAIVKLNNGARLEGTWLEATPDRFQMAVEKSRGKVHYGRGMQSFKREDVSTIHLRHRRVRGRVIGTTAGYFAGAGVVFAGSRVLDGIQGPWFLALVGGLIGGYQLGKVWDHQLTPVELVP